MSFLTVIILTAGMSSYMSLSFGRQDVAELTGQVKEVDIAKTVKDQPRGKTVLVLHTLKAKRPWNVLFNRYFTEALQENNLTLANLEIENLDLLQFQDSNYQEIVTKQLEHKYADSPPDIIIVTFASTIKFILENDLFPGIPKIFVLPTPSGLDDVPHSVVLPFAFEFKNNIAHALTLLPDTKSIYVVAGNGLMDKRLVSMFRDETKDFGDRVSFHYLDDLNVEELLGRLEQLPDDSFVYYLTYSLDFQGKAVITRDFSKSMGERSNRPVLSWLDLHALDIGILGGRVTTTRASATMSLDIVKKVFAGEPIDSIKPEPPYVEYIYQWEELKKWNIDLKKLPPDSVIQNRPYNYFEIFKWKIMGGIFLLVVESLLIFFLLINFRKRKDAENILRSYQIDLEKEIIDHQKTVENLNAFITNSSEAIWCFDFKPPIPMDLPVEEQFNLSYERAYVTKANDTVARMLGYEKGEELLGMSLDDFLPRTDPDCVAYMENLVREKFNIIDWESAEYGSDGEKRNFLSNILGIIEEGKLLKIWGTSRDITEQKRNERKLQQSEKRFRNLMEQSPLAMEILNPDGQIIMINKAWLQLWGVNEEEAKKATAHYNMLDDPQTVELGVAPLVQKAFAGEPVVLPMIEYSGQRAAEDVDMPDLKVNTVWIQCHLFPIKDKQNEVEFVVNTYNDLSAQTLANQERERILTLSKDLITIAGTDGYLKYVNPAWESILGYTAKELLERPYLDFVHPEDRYRAKQKFIKLAAGHPAFDFELRAICKDGSIRYISWVVTPYVEDNLMYCIGRDITERKKGEEEALVQRDILARIGRTTRMGELTGSIAHELNQPLTGILSNAQAGEMMIEMGQYDQDELAEILADIAADTKRAGEVLHNLRELYREQKGKYQALDINAIVDETIKLIHSEFVIQHVVLTTECASSIRMVHGNRIQIQQVLVNLIMNGIQAMGDTARDDRRLLIVTTYDENEVRAWVEDHGPGIDVDKIDSIFEPLATWKSGGTGMGLAISNSIIEAHGGKMWAENRPGGGARVGFRLPELKVGKEA